MTPPRQMPTGSFRMPTPPGQFQMTASNMTVLAPGTNPGGISSASDPTVLTPALGQATGRMVGGTTNQQPVDPTQQTGGAANVATQVESKAARSSGATKWLAAAGLVVAVAGIAFFVLKGGSASPPAAPDQSSTPPAPVATAQDPGAPVPPATPAPSPSPTSSPVASGAQAPSATTAGPTPTTTPSPAAGAAGGRAAAASARTGAPPPASIATPPGPGAVPADPAADAVLATFPNVKFFAVVDGKRTNDRDVVLNFVNGQVHVMPKNGGQPIAAVPYRRILRATYSLGRDPKWDESLPGPPAGIDVGSFMRQTKHWLVVQGADSYAMLRLEDNNYKQILETFELRTGLKVSRREK